MITSRQKAEKSGADGEKCWSAARVPVTPHRAISHTVKMGQTVPNVDAKGSVLKVSTSYWFVWERSRSQRVSDLPFLWRGEAAPLGFGFLTEAANRQNRRGFILVYYNLFEEGNTFTSSVLRARGGTQDMWTWITRQKLETLDKKSTRLGLQRQLLIPSKLTLTVFQYPNYHTVRYARFGMSQYEVCEMQYAKKVRMSHYI